MNTRAAVNWPLSIGASAAATGLLLLFLNLHGLGPLVLVGAIGYFLGARHHRAIRTYLRNGVARVDAYLKNDDTGDSR